MRETAAPRRPTSWARCWLEGAGAGIIVMMPLLWLNLTPSRETHYHELLPMNSVYQGLLIDFVVVLSVCIPLIWLLDRWDSRCRTLLWLPAMAMLATRVERVLVIATDRASLMTTPGRIFLGVAVPGLLLWFLRRRWYRGAMRGLRVGVLLVGFCVFWILPELAVMAFHPEPHDTAGFSRPVAAPVQRRIVWILFDEASYDQLFDHPQPGMSYPNFDRLATDSVLFSDVRPGGNFTELVIPSLLSGHYITSVKSDLDGQLLIRTEDNSHWRPYPDRDSLFGEAQHLGWSTGAIGWYNPYCRLFASELNDCYWTFTTRLYGHYSPTRSAVENAIAPLGKSALHALGQPILYTTDWQVHADDYQRLMERSVEEIASNRVGFLFLHLPLPHPGGFYNRHTGQIGVPGSYLDNLALTDVTLGELMRDIDNSALGPKTTVIVSSDHSWRTWLWRPLPGWAAEDARASRGGFDPRPLLMVHFPGETEATTVARPVPLLSMHGLLLEMMAGRIESPQQLEAWAAQQ
ncbi:MAG: sulfatase-like hydrolase/transferase [Acidobacteriaceae bacterium]